MQESMPRIRSKSPLLQHFWDVNSEKEQESAVKTLIKDGRKYWRIYNNMHLKSSNQAHSGIVSYTSSNVEIFFILKSIL